MFDPLSSFLVCKSGDILEWLWDESDGPKNKQQIFLNEALSDFLTASCRSYLINFEYKD